MAASPSILHDVSRLFADRAAPHVRREAPALHSAPMRHGDRLSQDDVARLHMASRDNPMTIAAMLCLDAPLSIDALRDRVRARLLARPPLRARIVEAPHHPPRWVADTDFDLRAHVHHVALPSGPTALEDLVGDLASTPLDRTLPLWQMHLVDAVGDGCAVIVRVHHVIADGLALVDLLLELTDEGPGDWTPPAVSTPPGAGIGAAVAALRSTAGLVLSRPEPSTALTRHTHTHKHFAWTAPLDLPSLKASARRHGAGITATLLALTAGALRRALQTRQRVGTTLTLRAMVPLSTRDPVDGRALGNRFASIFVPLPVGLDGFDARVSAITERLRTAEFAGGMASGRRFVRIAGRVGATVERLGVALLSRKASVLVSNVPGPRDRRHIAGRALTSVVAFAPTAGAIGLGITFLGYGPEVSIGVSAGLSDPSLARDVAEGITAEYRAVLARDAAPGSG